MKRLLCLVSSMNTGGAETFLMKIYRKLDKTKYQMDFCVNVPDKGFYDDEIRSNGGQIYIVPSKSSSLKQFRHGIADVVKNNHYDYVMRVTSNAMGFWDLKIAKDSGAKCCIARSSNSSDGGGFKFRLSHKIGRMLYMKFVNVKLAPSDLAAIYTFGKNEYNAGKVTLLHNAVDLNVFHYDEGLRKRIRREFGIDDNLRVLGHIGRFSNQKNHAFLLDVFKAYLEEQPLAVLLLVGTGELEEQVKRKTELLEISDKVIFAGTRSDVPALLSAMDVFVFPSFYEGMPNTVIEAQSTGLSCIIADTITREADITGLVHYLPLGDISMWVEAIDKCANKAIDRTDTECVQKKFVENGYDIENVTREFEHLIFG